MLYLNGFVTMEFTKQTSVKLFRVFGTQLNSENKALLEKFYKKQSPKKGKLGIYVEKRISPSNSFLKHIGWVFFLLNRINKKIDES